tara:strand:+ start:10977 stop:11267 length:291 start_codon:yes stop_codon:yes gene_type:complete
MSTANHSGNIQTIRGYTNNLSDAQLHWQALGSDIGAPWEIYIKSTTRNSGSAWGTSTYSPSAAAQLTDPSQVGLTYHMTEALGNDIHRVLKYYLQH